MDKHYVFNNITMFRNSVCEHWASHFGANNFKFYISGSSKGFLCYTFCKYFIIRV